MYKPVEYPKVVYGPNGQWKTIQRAEERPDGWKDSPKDVVEDAKADAKKATRAAAAAEKKERKSYMDFLDKHKVVYDKNLDTDKLEALAGQLQEHLNRQPAAGGDGNGQ